MTIDKQSILTLSICQGMFEKQVNTLKRLMEADGRPVSDAIGRRENYNEEKTRSLIRDIIAAYDAYPEAARVRVSSMTQAAAGSGPDPDTVLGDGDEEGFLLDELQRKLLAAMLYCLLRLVAESPFFANTFGRFKRSCSKLLCSFDVGASRDAIEAWGILRRASGRRPCTPDDMAARFSPETGRFSGTYEYSLGLEDGTIEWASAFPSLEMAAGNYYSDVRTDGYAVSNRGPGPYGPVDWLFDDLDCLYEMLSGEMVPAFKRSAQEGFRPDDKLVGQMVEYMDANELRTALELGWLSQEGYDERMRKIPGTLEYFEDWANEEFSDSSPEAREEIAREEFEQDRKEREERARSALLKLEDGHTKGAVQNLRKWAEEFPEKEAWCEEYLIMREAYLELGGIYPVGYDEPGAYYGEEGRGPIDAHVLGTAIDAALDERGLSHFNDEVFMRVSSLLIRCEELVKDYERIGGGGR